MQYVPNPMQRVVFFLVNSTVTNVSVCILPLGWYRGMQGLLLNETTSVLSQDPAQHLLALRHIDSRKNLPASLRTISHCLATKMCGTFSNKSFYLLVMGNKEQQQYMALLWMPLGAPWPVTLRKITCA